MCVSAPEQAAHHRLVPPTRAPAAGGRGGSPPLPRATTHPRVSIAAGRKFAGCPRRAVLSRGLSGLGLSPFPPHASCRRGFPPSVGGRSRYRLTTRTGPAGLRVLGTRPSPPSPRGVCVCGGHTHTHTHGQSSLGKACQGTGGSAVKPCFERHEFYD